MNPRKSLFAAIFAATAMAELALPHIASAASVTAKQVVETYADIAHAVYEDSLLSAQSLRDAIAALTAKPSPATLLRARQAWLSARQPYQQSEGFRFGNAIVDDWEGKVNAWPLDEGLIDYVAASYGKSSKDNPYYTANIIANATLKFGSRMIDATKITPKLLSDTLHEVDKVESNVATGYHAIEFLLWAQDLNGTGPGAGNRPHTDFSIKSCSHGHCDRRIAYLEAAADLLLADLGDITAAWAKGGAARKAVTADPNRGVAAIIKGLGSLSYGELAGERIQLGLMLHDPEEEHDCFSDNTHNSHYFDQIGMMSIYRGRYVRIDGSSVAGPGLKHLIAAKSPALAGKIDGAMRRTLDRMSIMKGMADRREMAYDQMLGEGNKRGNKVVQDVVDGLVLQAKALEEAIAAVGLTNVQFEGSDSLDNPAKVLQ